MSDYRVLLYYQYVNIEDPERFRKEHKALCDQLELKGRILVSDEGLNGTLSGTVENTQKYMDAMHADERFAEMPFKIDEADEHTFQKNARSYTSRNCQLKLRRRRCGSEPNHRPTP